MIDRWGDFKLLKRTLTLVLVFCGLNLFAAAEKPAQVGERIVNSLLASPPPVKKLTPVDVQLWVNAIDFAERHTVNGADKLAARYTASVDDGLDDIVPAPRGADGAFFAVLPLTLARRTPDANRTALGLRHVAALPDLNKQPRAENAFRHALVLARAFAASKDAKFGDRAVRDVCALVQKLRRKDGLFASVPTKAEARARGNGAMALAILAVRPCVSGKDPNGPSLRAALADLALTLEPLQRENGLWGQVVDDPKSPDDPEGSAMIAAALASGAEDDCVAWGFLGLARRTLATLVEIKKPTPTLEAGILALAKALADADSPLTAEQTRKKPRKPGRMQLTPGQRASAGGVAASGQFRLESTYACISAAWGAPREFADGVKMAYRKVGAADWQAALEPEFYSPAKNYRGSIVNLEEDTEYEVRLEAEGETQVSGKVRTWATKVPVAKTVEIDPETAVFPIVINDQAPADGWVRYVPKGGRPLVNGTKEKTFAIEGAKHVILDGFTIVGGHGFCSILVDKSAEGVRILNCEISGWGPAAVGSPNGAICLASDPHEVTIERCFVHSPRGRAQSWRYSHPYGPQAVRLSTPRSLVIRWCDFVGCDSRRFDDVIKCSGNAGYHSGLNRNSDVCGCFLFGANDDCIELDGGQQNVRFFGNRCEEALMGVSIQCNMTSPSYVFDNAFTGLGSEFGHRVSAIKTASVDTYHYGAVSYLFHNTFCGPGSRHGALDVGANWETARLRTYNNLFVGATQGLCGDKNVRGGRLGGNVVTADEAALVSVRNARVAPVKPSLAAPIANFSRPQADGKAVVGAPCDARLVTLPERPVPWALDTGRLVTTVAKGAASPAAERFRLVCGGTGYKAHFAVRTANFDNGWFDVSPKEGTIESGKTIDFTVTFRPERLNRRHRYAAAFVIRTDDGFGRPVSLHAETDYVAPFKVENPRGTIVYGEKSLAGDNMWDFALPTAGTWYLYFRGSHPGAVFCDQEKYLTDVTPFLNEVKLSDVSLPVEKWSSWVPLDPAEEGMKGFKLTAGEQTVRLTGFDKGLRIEGLLFASDPMDVEDAKREP